MQQTLKRLVIGAAAWLLPLMIGTSVLAQSTSDSLVRFVHAVPGAPAVDIYADGSLAISALAFGEVTDFLGFGAGDHQMTVTLSGSSDPLWQQNLSLQPGAAQTLVAVAGDPPTFQVHPDDVNPLSLGEARFTAVHAIPGGPAVDVVLSDGRPVVAGLENAQVYGTLDIPALAYELAVVPSGESLDAALVAPQAFPLSSGTSYTLLIYGTADRPLAQLLSASAAPSGESGFLRLAHGIPGAPDVDVYLDDQLIAPALSFGSGASEYLAIPAGDYAVTVYPTGETSDALIEADVTVEDQMRATVIALSDEDTPTLRVFTDSVDSISAEEAVISLINALPGESTVTLELADGTAIGAEVAAGESETTAAAPTQSTVAALVNANGESVKLDLPISAIYGGVYYNILAVEGEDGAQALLLDATSLAQTVASAPMSGTTVAAAQPATPEATAEATEAAEEVIPLAPPSPTAAAPAVTVAPLATEPPAPEAAQPTAAPATNAQPTARILLDPGANLQLRQFPDSNALSLGLAPSGATVLVNGRQGAPQFPQGVTPEASEAEFVDPADNLAEGEDLSPDDVWLNVTYNTPDGGAITAWVSAIYLSVSGPTGQPISLVSLPTVPGNRAGFAQNTAVTPPVERQSDVLAVVGNLDENVNLQIRRIPSTVGESLALVATGTQLEFLGLNETGEWVFVRYAPTASDNVTGWVNALYIVDYVFEGRSVDLGELEQRNLLVTVPETETGRAGGTIAAPAAPTRDPLRNTIVGEVFLNEGVNLHLRRNPDVASESLALIPSGTQLIIEGRTEAGDWLRTSYESLEGWVSAQFLELSFNGLDYALAEVPVFQAPLTDPLAQATATAISEITPSPAPTQVRQRIEILVDAVQMTSTPAGSGDGLPILTRGRIINFLNFSPDGRHSFVETEDGITGWIPTETYQLYLLD